MINDLLWKLLGKVGIQKEGSYKFGDWSNKEPQAPVVSNSPVQQYQASEPQTYQAPTPTATVQQYQQNPNIRGAIKRYGGAEEPPLMKYAPIIEQATIEQDFWRNNPYLPIVLAQLETSMGRNITRPNNFLNYGIRSSDINALFEKVGLEDALRRSLLEIGTTGNTYKSFRTGQPLTDEEIMSFGSIYEPENADYPQNLLNGIRELEQYLGGGY